MHSASSSHIERFRRAAFGLIALAVVVHGTQAQAQPHPYQVPAAPPSTATTEPADLTLYRLGGGALLAVDFGAGLYLTTATWRGNADGDPALASKDPLALGLGIAGFGAGATVGALMTNDKRLLLPNGIASQIGGMGGGAVGLTGLLVNILGCDRTTDEETHQCGNRGVRFFTASLGVGTLLGGTGAIVAMLMVDDDSSDAESTASVRWRVVPGGVVGVF